MHLNWYGQGSIGIKGKDVEIIIDPFLSKETGLKEPKTKDKIVLASKFGTGKSFKNDAIRIIDSPGEYEFSEIFIYGTKVKDDYPKIVYSLTFEGMSLVHLGSISETLSEDAINELSGTDVLFVPVGGEDVLSPSKAAKLISQIGPKIIIPIYYQVTGLKTELGSLNKFVKEIGLSPQEEDKVILKKKDLEEDVKLITLKP